jgi:hypothetical protein
VVFIINYSPDCQLTFQIPPDKVLSFRKLLFNHEGHEENERLRCYYYLRKMNCSIINVWLSFVPFVVFVAICQSNQADFTEGLVVQDPVRSEYGQIQCNRKLEDEFGQVAAHSRCLLQAVARETVG